MNPQMPDLPDDGIACCYIAMVGYMVEGGRMKYACGHSDATISQLLGLCELAKLDLHAEAASWESE